MAVLEDTTSVMNVLGFNEICSEHFIKCLFTEFLGTFILIVAGCGSVLTIDPQGSPNGIDCAFLFGMTVAMIVWTLGHVSGAHINPTVSFCFMVTGTLSFVRFVAYTVMQCLGAIAGAAVLWQIVPPTWRQTLGSTVFADDLTLWQGILIEILATFFLMLAIFSCGDNLRTDHAGSVPLTIGFVVFVQSVWAGKLTGCSMNPARTLGPAMISGAWDHHWVYWVAPTVGGTIGSFLYKYVLAERLPDAAKKLSESKKPGHITQLTDISMVCVGPTHTTCISNTESEKKSYEVSNNKYSYF